MAASPELIIDGRSSNENVKNTKERVELQVNKELQQLTNEIGKKFYEINENGEVEYDLNLVKKYLESIKDKQYSELKSKNTGAWIMAVQIALSSTGYDVGKIDGILKNKGAKTSRTIEQIIKFQKDNGLKPDGQPGSKTITKLLEKLGPTTIQDGNIEKRQQENNNKKQKENNNKIDDKGEEIDNKELITKEKFDELCFKSSLTDEEMKQVVDYANEKGGSRLSLRINRIKNPNQLNELGKIKSTLILNNIKSITDEELKGLCSVKELKLGITLIKPEHAEIISNSSVEKLELFSLNGRSYKVGNEFSSMSNDIVKKFAESRNLRELIITYNWLTPKQQEDLKDKLVY